MNYLKNIKIRFNFKRCIATMNIAPLDKIDLSGMRAPYETDDVKRDFSIKHPLKLFDSWFSLARNTETIKEANAMAVASADRSGKPSVRYVLLKGYGKEGFTFYTNYNSRKGQEINENPQVALLFYWDFLCRQVRIEGKVVKSSDKESEEYFYSRPRSSQLSAAVSRQSELIENKDILLRRKEELEQKYADPDMAIPRPDCWGGYLVVPDSFEFWSGRSDRLHDRIRFRHPSPKEVIDEKLTYTGEDGWVYEFLSP